MQNSHRPDSSSEDERVGALAKKGLALDQDIMYFDCLPMDLYLLLFYDTLALLLLILFVRLYQKREGKGNTCNPFLM